MKPAQLSHVLGKLEGSADYHYIGTRTRFMDRESGVISDPWANAVVISTCTRWAISHFHNPLHTSYLRATTGGVSSTREYRRYLNLYTPNLQSRS